MSAVVENGRDAMPTSVVELRPETIVDLAKDVLRPAPIYCEWNVRSLQKPSQCRTPLNSWNAYLKHLERHCRENKDYKRGCRLPRCNVPSGVPLSSIRDLLTHIQQSHLGRTQLYCPIRQCPSISFSRPALLEIHFADAHPDLIGRKLSLSSPILRTTAVPFAPPLDPTPPPLPLPPCPSAPGTALLPPVPATPFHSTTRHTTPALPLSQSSSVSPRKKRQLQASSSLDSIPATAAAPERLFADLPHGPDAVHQMLIVPCPDHSVVPDVSRPQDILDPVKYGYRVPPGSILYPNFVRIHNLQHHGEPPDGPPPDKPPPSS